MSEVASPKSIHDLPPIETGGVEARQGFAVQDHVAAGFLIDMLLDDSLTQVWCETHDDITLIWQVEQSEEVEFVQVKSEELNQLWSVAKLCERERLSTDKEGLGTSILEKSLANDRCCEPCSFRVVTCRPVQNELKILTYPLDSEYRRANPAKFADLEKTVGLRVGDYHSPNGNDHGFWLSNTLWEELHSQDSIEGRNLIKSSRLVQSEGVALFTDQLQELYSGLVAKAHAAAASDWRLSPQGKKIRREDLFEWFRKSLTKFFGSASSGGGKALREKMQDAGLPTDTIDAALEQRRYYRREVLKPEYLKLANQRLVEQEVVALLQRLRAQLDAGLIPDSGPAFHNTCLEELSQLRSALGIIPPPFLSFIYGCMYSIADRCLHRFRRAAA